MKIFITGVAGFIGFHLAKKLCDEGHYVYGIDNLDNYYDISLKNCRLKILQSSKKFSFIQTDLNDLQLIEETFDLGINFAAQAGVRIPTKFHNKYEHSNVYGFKSFLNFCKQMKIKKIIYASSSSVYSDKNREKFAEDTTELFPKSVYGISKLSNEKYADRYALENSLNILGLRFFSVYGPWGRPDMAYYLFTDCLKNDKPITLFNNGEMFRDMTYIDDIIDGVISSIHYISKKNDMCSHEVFNLGNNKPISTLEIIGEIKKHLKKEGEFIHKKSENEAYYTHACIKKADKILGYSPKTDFKEGITKFLKWYEQFNQER